MPQDRSNPKIQRRVTRLPLLGTDPFYGTHVISTTIPKDILLEIEKTITKSGLTRAEFIRHAVIREFAFHKMCDDRKVDPTTHCVPAVKKVKPKTPKRGKKAEFDAKAAFETLREIWERKKIG